MCGSIVGKLGKGDRETGEDREDESLKNQKICGAFVVAEGEEEGDRGWSDWRLARGWGATTTTVWVLSQGKGDGETWEEEDERTKKYLYFKILCILMENKYKIYFTKIKFLLFNMI